MDDEITNLKRSIDETERAIEHTRSFQETLGQPGLQLYVKDMQEKYEQQLGYLRDRLEQLLKDRETIANDLQEAAEAA